MRYVCMHKASPQDEAGEPPPPDLVAGMGELIGATAQAGKFLAGEGLRPSSMRYRMTFRGDGCEVSQGPWPGDGELPQRLLVLRVPSVESALDWARRFGRAAGAARLEVGPLTEPWDLGMMPKPDGEVPLRFLLLQQATAESERGTRPSPQVQRAVEVLLEEMRAAGVLAFSEALEPSADGVRLRYTDGRRVRTDGPFTESKELIGGFCMVRMDSLDEVLAWTDRFARIIGGTCEVDVRVVVDER